MHQHLNEHDVRTIAAYTRIALAEDELTSMTVDLNSIIDSLKPITEYDLEGIEPTFHPIGARVNVFREDVEEQGFSQEEALLNAPESRDGYFVVPAILGGGEE